MVDNGSVRLPDRPEDADVTDLHDLLVVDERLGAPVGRRIVLGLSALGGLGVLFGRAAQQRSQAVAERLPGGDVLTQLLPVGGQFRIYTVTGGYPKRRKEDYTLTLDGMVDQPLTLSYDDLLSRDATEFTKDFQCVTGWRVENVPWVGVRLSALLDEAGVRASATALRFSSFDGAYTESLTLEQARRNDVIVAYSMLGGDISRANGGPVRLYVAPMYGYKSIKWLERIEVIDEVIPGYWEERGYDVDAWIGRSNGRDDEPV
jgi:DMSO/TMAO reductase YedYZ molybdopterin-dependent catalytic subunit